MSKMKIKDIFRLFGRKKKKTAKKAPAVPRKAEKNDPNAWPTADAASNVGGEAWPVPDPEPAANDVNAWPDANAAPEEEIANAWPDANVAPDEGDSGAWPDAAEGDGAWPSDGGEWAADGGDAAWPDEGSAEPPAQAATKAESEEEGDGKKKKDKKKKSKKAKKPKKGGKKKGDAGEGESEEGGKKKKPPLLLIMIPAVAIIAAAAVLLILKPWGSKEPREEEPTEEVEPAEEEPAEEEPAEEEPVDGEPTPEEPKPAAPAPMDTAAAMDRFAAMSPESLGLEGESMSEYRYYATGKTITVDGIKCREIMVYSVSGSAGTNDIEGRYLLSMDGRKVFRDAGERSIVEISPSVIGLEG